MLLKNILYCTTLLFLFTKGQKAITVPEIGSTIHASMKLDSVGIQIYSNEIRQAIYLLLQQKKTIEQELKPNEQCKILAVGFPEVLRYNTFSDYIETSTNRLLYIQSGKKLSDFSIGMFQMKPSFVENLELYVQENQNLKDYKYIVLDSWNQTTNRKNRINRLESFRWQLRYLKLFWIIMDDKYKQLIFSNQTSKIRFYATAYNYGFTRPLHEIIAFQKIKNFPFGKNTSQKPVAFADFSIEFTAKYPTYVTPKQL